MKCTAAVTCSCDLESLSPPSRGHDFWPVPRVCLVLISTSRFAAVGFLAFLAHVVISICVQGVTGFNPFFNTFLVVFVRSECLLAKPATGDAMRLPAAA